MKALCVMFISGLLTVAAIAQDVRKVSNAEVMAAVVSRASAEYPPIAKQLKVHGIAELEVVVAEDGSVDKVTIVSGNPILTKPAAEAVRKWKFKPFLVDGKPVKVAAPVTFDFKI